MQIVLELLKAKNNCLMRKTCHLGGGGTRTGGGIIKKIGKNQFDTLFSHGLPVSYHHRSKHLMTADGTKFKRRIHVRG